MGYERKKWRNLRELAELVSLWNRVFGFAIESAECDTIMTDTCYITSR